MASINNNVSQLYRITYEAYSKFANSINRCSSLTEVGEVAEKHLKYILNFHLIKIIIQQNDKFIEYSLCANKIWHKTRKLEELREIERNLLDNGIPIKTGKFSEEFVDKRLDLSKLINPQLWGWIFNKNDHNMMIFLIADENRIFSARDIEILKLAADCFDAKFRELNLKRELAKKNKSLEDALRIISEKNTEISKINSNQKKIINKRTQEIIKKNEKLLQISVLNAHNVKEPLSRIQGIIELFDLMDDESCREELLPKLKLSAQEMDKIVKQVIAMASKELIDIKAKK